MVLGIVGSEAAKFTPQKEEEARQLIRKLLTTGDMVHCVISGGCHLGGIDIWAIQEAKKLGIKYGEFLPVKLSWDGGYKLRNQLIAQESDKVVCITVKVLPDGYTGMRFKLCYHCGTADHVKSGGCWTVKYAKKIGKEGIVMVV